jgi:Uma2 family endonuclease
MALHTTRSAVEQYLDSDFRPDCEYIDGEIRERNVGKTEHARMQALLAAWFGSHEDVWGIKVGTEWRVRVAPDRVRVPDLAVVYSNPLPGVMVEPPVLVIEILSPDDTYPDTHSDTHSDTQERAKDYLKMGIETIWIIDPTTRSGRVCSGRERIESDRLEVKGTPLYVDLPGLFSRI